MEGGEIMCEVQKEHLACGLTGGGAGIQCSEVDPYILQVFWFEPGQRTASGTT